MFIAAFATVTVFFFVMYLMTCFGSYEPSSGEVRVYKCYGIRYVNGSVVYDRMSRVAKDVCTRGKVYVLL
jgi:hypothetical protein